VSKNYSRRQFLKVFSTAIGVIAAASIGLLSKFMRDAIAKAPDKRIFFPLVSNKNEPTPTGTPTPTKTVTVTGTPTQTSTTTVTPSGTLEIGPKVVHVHNTNATSWDGSDPQYWNYVDQDIVNEMVNQGVMSLTNTSSVVDAWSVILPYYQQGQGIGIKVNLNHSTSCSEVNSYINALIHPINAIISGLKNIGLAESDIWIYDAIRFIPDHFVSGCQYNNVKFFDFQCRNKAGFESEDPSAYINFTPPAGIPLPASIRVTDQLVNATYLINIPIMRIHSSTGVTLSFKNHFGSIDHPSDLHEYVFLGWNYYRSDYNPLIDLYQHPHIINKTILTIGDGLIAAKRWKYPDSQWTTFGNKVPNSLFFTTDPVALDCVMCDFLAAETDYDSRADEYLQIASNAGLGVYERGDPFRNNYQKIQYQRLDQ
jgi:hypothetical protein